MDVLIPAQRDETYEALSRREVLQTLEPLARDLMKNHLEKRRLWFPSDFLPADEQMSEDEERNLLQMRERARGLPDSIRTAVVLNLLTEEGLPHFHRVISDHLDNSPTWRSWNYLWTAEENRHGTVIHDYARDARLFRMREVEVMQYSYNEAGFTPEWEMDPYRLFAYTTLQERATQVSHRNTGRLAGEYDPTLKGILSSVAADEAKHYAFYRSVFAGVLECDPNRALESAVSIMPSLLMPGSSMPHYREMADVVHRSGIYTAWDYKEIVEEAIQFWAIGALEGLKSAGRAAQEKIMGIPARLRKVAERTEQRTRPKTFAFDFIYGRSFLMESPARNTEY